MRCYSTPGLLAHCLLHPHTSPRTITNPTPTLNPRPRYEVLRYLLSNVRYWLEEFK